MSTLWTEDPRTVATYDTECAGRADHDLYLRLADQLGARTVVDLGCGTGVLAVDLAPNTSSTTPTGSRRSGTRTGP